MHQENLYSDEGMWLFNNPPRELLKKKYDFDLTDTWLEHLQKASVRFNDGGWTVESLCELLAKGGETGPRKRAPAATPVLAALAQVQADEMIRRGTRRRLRANLLLLVDQLENIFAANITDQQRAAFARLLFALCASRRVWAVATIRSDIYPRLITPGDFLALKDVGGVYDLASGFVHSAGGFRCLEDVEQGPLAGCLAGEGIRWDTGEVLESTMFKCAGSADEAAKTAITSDTTAVLESDFYRAGDGVDESFTAQLIVSSTDIAPDIEGFQNLWIQGVGCGTAILNFR